MRWLWKPVEEGGATGRPSEMVQGEGEPRALKREVFQKGRMLESDGKEYVQGAGDL